MEGKIKEAAIPGREFVFQLALHCFVFIFYAFDNTRPHHTFQIQWHHIVFFLNYAAANAVISYIFLPRFYYRKKYWLFFSLTLVLIIMVILLEEFVLEQIFFADTRGAYFPGFVFSLAQVTPIIVILSGFKFAWDALSKQREVEKLKALIQESELQFLNSQINPHFLFNNLNNLYAYAIENSPKTPTIILELSSILRYMLYECKEKYVPLEKEINQIQNFVELYKLQIEDRGEVNFSTGNIQPGFLIAPLILIVFVENAFKHSQANQSANIKIDVSLQLSNKGQFEFRCKNNYQPHNGKPDDDSGHGIGLNNVRQRLQLIYPGNHHLDIHQTEKIYEVSLSLKLKQAGQ